MLTRTYRTPAFVFIGLLVIIGILSYSYWDLVTQNNNLKLNLQTNEEKFNDVSIKKSSVDKQNEAYSNRIKYFEERIEQNNQALKKKDDEMSEVTQKLKDANDEIDKQKQTINDNQAKLVSK